MDHCSTKHICSNSACQMFADKWLYSRTQKKKKKIISDKQRYRQMTDHTKQAKTGKCQTTLGGHRPGSNQTLDHIGLPSAMDRYCLARHCVVSVEA